MSDINDPTIRIADLERELKQRDDKIKELRTELTEVGQVLDDMREQTEDHNRVIERWIEVFGMEQDEHGVWQFEQVPNDIWDDYSNLYERHRALLQRWNKFVPEYNATIRRRDMGRPITASEAQREEVLQRSAAGESLRAIGKAMGLGLSTVRTVIAKRPTRSTNVLQRREFDRKRAAAYRARKKARDALPAQITELQKTGEALFKAAKGLGR